MADGHNDGSIAPRRSLQGPILPPAPPEIADGARKAQEEREAAERAAAEKQAARQAREAEKEAARRERAEQKSAQKSAQAEQRSAQKSAQADQRARDKAAKEQAAAQKSAQSAQASARTSAQAAPQATTRSPRSPQSTGSTAAVASQGPGQDAGQGRAESGRRPQGGGGKPAKAGKSARRTRRAQLRLVQVDAWSVMKTSFLLSIALGIVLVVAVAIIWSVLGAAGVWDSINSIVQQAVGNDSGTQFDITKYVGTSRILGFTMIVAVIDVILITAIATLGAFLYNLSAALLGGIEVTLAEDS